jgi:hypothetical protein
MGSGGFNQGSSYGEGGYGGGGQGGGYGGQGPPQQGNGGNNWNQWESQPPAQQTCPPPPSCPPQMTCPACPPAHEMTKTMTETVSRPVVMYHDPADLNLQITVTAASACAGSTVTAYVTQWQNAPPGCFCGPPPTGLAFGGGAAAAVTAAASITPGLSSIPASLALVTGVTVAGAPPAAAAQPTGASGAVSPGSFFGASSKSILSFRKP